MATGSESTSDADGISWPRHASSVLVAYLKDGEDGLSRVADRLHERAHERPNGKFTKAEASYLPQTPVPPNAWRNCCGRCRFWRDGGPDEAGRCHVVGREGDRFGGERIHPNGWCALWMPPPNEPAFAWLFEQLDPTGADLIRGEYRPDGDRGREAAGGDGNGSADGTEGGNEGEDGTER